MLLLLETFSDELSKAELVILKESPNVLAEVAETLLVMEIFLLLPEEETPLVRTIEALLEEVKIALVEVALDVVVVSLLEMIFEKLLETA